MALARSTCLVLAPAISAAIEDALPTLAPFGATPASIRSLASSFRSGSALAAIPARWPGLGKPELLFFKHLHLESVTLFALLTLHFKDDLLSRNARYEGA